MKLPIDDLVEWLRARVRVLAQTQRSFDRGSLDPVDLPDPPGRSDEELATFSTAAHAIAVAAAMRREGAPDDVANAQLAAIEPELLAALRAREDDLVAAFEPIYGGAD